MNESFPPRTENCEAFLQVVKNLEGAQQSIDYKSVLDDLIAWSESLSGLLVFRRRPDPVAGKNQQFTVTYCLPESGRVFWQAYPPESKRYSAKLHIELQAGDLRDNLRQKFLKLFSSRPRTLPTHAVIRFPDLIPVENRENVKRLLVEVLAKLQQGT